MTTLNAIYSLSLLMALMGMLIHSYVKLDVNNARLQPKAILIESSRDVVEQLKKSERDSYRRDE